MTSRRALREGRPRPRKNMPAPRRRAREGGIKAIYPSECDRCSYPINKGDGIILRPGGGLIHAACASGQDE